MKSRTIIKEVQQTMRLKQLGANVEIINSKLCYVKFVINGMKVSYVYNINKKNEYFLERIKPYPLPVASFENEEDIVNLIKVDIEQFKNVTNSKNVNDFINFTKDLEFTVNKFEDLVLYYNVSKEDMDILKESLNDLNRKIRETKKHSERLYFEKNPNSLNDEDE